MAHLPASEADFSGRLLMISAKIDRLDERLQTIERHVPRTEYILQRGDKRFDQVDAQLAELRDFMRGTQQSTTDRRWLVALTLSTGLSLVGVVLTAARLLNGSP